MIADYSSSLAFSQLTDEEIIPIAQSGSCSAEEYLLKKYQYIVKAKARPYFITGGDREDILQEGLIGLHKAIRDFQLSRGIPFRAFAELCITRQIISAIKSATRQKHMPLNYYISLNCPIYRNDESNRTLLDIIANKKISNPEELLLSQEEWDAFNSKLALILSDFEYRVFVLYIQCVSYRDMAKALGTTTKAVDNALCRIKRKICEKIKNTL